MNHFRLGYAESTAVFIYYLTEIIKIFDLNDPLLQPWLWLIPHMYYSSGYYDKLFDKVPIDNEKNIIICEEWLNISNSKEMFKSECFQHYIKKTINILYYCETIDINLFDYKNSLNNYTKEFIAYFKAKHVFGEQYDKKNDLLGVNNVTRTLYSFIKNKNILIINSMSELMKNQYDSGNLHKINSDFPIINNITAYRMPYTFFNDGPDNSIHETCDKINAEIKNINFDCAIISAGAYSCLIGGFISNEMNKHIFVIGGYLLYIFGIMNVRSAECQYEFNNKEYWITVPDEYKPKNYKNIERGCYW